ncbi:MAG: hypothetical protein ABF759_12455 [Acetobacter malorum]
MACAWVLAACGMDPFGFEQASFNLPLLVDGTGDFSVLVPRDVGGPATGNAKPLLQGLQQICWKVAQTSVVIVEGSAGGYAQVGAQLLVLCALFARKCAPMHQTQCACEECFPLCRAFLQFGGLTRLLRENQPQSYANLLQFFWAFPTIRHNKVRISKRWNEKFFTRGTGAVQAPRGDYRFTPPPTPYCAWLCIHP